MLRYYEAEGLLMPRRTASGFREYSLVDEQTVERIKLLASGGMTLATIKQFSSCLRGDELVLDPCDELRATLRDQIQLIDQKSERLAQTRKVLEKFLCEVNR
jgi:DNA-binding transcriptional MerR regulator